MAMKQIAPGIMVNEDYDPTPAGWKPPTITPGQAPSSYGGLNPDAFGAAMAKIGQTIQPYPETNTTIDKKTENLPKNLPISTSNAPTNAYSSYLPQAHPDTFMSDTQKYLQDLYSNRLSAGTTQLNNTRDTALQGLNLQKTQSQQTAYDNRNSADVQNVQAGQRLRELMAEQGLTSSGDNVSATVGLQAARQNSLNDINRQEGNQLQDLSQKGALISNQAASNQQALQQELDAQRAQALQQLTQYADTRQFRNDQADFDRKVQLAQLLGYSPDGAQTLQSRNSDQQYALNLAGLTGQINGQSTLDAQRLAQQIKESNLNASRQIGQDLGRIIRPTNDWGLLYDQTNAPLNWNAQMDLIRSGQSQQQIDNQAKQFAEKMGFDWTNMSLEDKRAWSQIAISQQNANTNSKQADWSMSPDNPDNVYKQQQITKMTADLNALKQTKTISIQDAVDILNKSTFVTSEKDVLGKPIANGRPVAYDKFGLAKAITSFGLPDDQTKQLFSVYNIDPEEIRKGLNSPN